MTDDDYGEDRDPLLVRPFLLHDSGSPAAEPSTQTWPSATTREVRSHRALEGADDPTAILYLPPPRRRPTRRRLAVVAVASVAVLLGAAVTGVAALRPDGHRPATTALQDPPPLATTGPLPGTPSPVASSKAPSRSAGASRRAAAPTGSGTPATSGTASVESGTAVVSPTAQGARTTEPPAALAPAPPAGRTGPIRGQNGLCLDLTGGLVVEDNRVQVLGCNGSAAQLWTLATDGTMQVSGMCALIVGDNTVHITKCDGRTTAQWRISGQRLINAANARCLTDPSGGTAPGTPVRVTICGGAADQRWSLP